MNKCVECKKDYMYHLTDSNTGIKEYYCKLCFYTYLKSREISTMPDFLKKLTIK